MNPRERTLVVAVLGLGEAGSLIARDLAAAGAEVRGYDPAVAAAPGITDTSSEAVQRIIDGTRTHAVRRTAEMDSAADMLTELGVQPYIAEASRAVHERLSAEPEPSSPSGQRAERFR